MNVISAAAHIMLGNLQWKHTEKPQEPRVSLNEFMKVWGYRCYIETLVKTNRLNIAKLHKYNFQKKYRDRESLGEEITKLP